MAIFDDILKSASRKVCVIAAPGSGKTSRVIMPKAKAILQDPAIDPEEVLLLTFSRLSAMDLQKTVSTMKRIPRAMTVHSFCLQFLLCENNHQIRDRVESILIEFEKETLICDLKTLFPNRHKRYLKDDLKQFSAGWATRQHDEVFEEDEYRRSFKTAVTNWLSEHEAAMLEEIVYYAVDLARQLPDAPFIQRPQYILVDEFQDLNRLEQEFIELLAADSQLLVVVGDPDQSIYSFKYAYPAGIRAFAEREDVQSYGHLVTGRRAVFFNRLGEIRDRSFENQRHRASGLNLLVAAIILWNTTYLQRAVDHLCDQGAPARTR